MTTEITSNGENSIITLKPNNPFETAIVQSMDLSKAMPKLSKDDIGNLTIVVTNHKI